MKIGSSTPHGKADHVTLKAPGIWQYSTPGHGGYKLDRARNAAVHPALRRKGGWYEEDCEYAKVVLNFHALYTSAEVEQAHHTAKQYYPDTYTAATGNPVTLAESRVLREREFHTTHANDHVVTSAWGDWHGAVPKDHVGVVACLGGDRTKRDTERYFLLTAAQYETRAEFGFVIDLATAKVWENHP
jgi:hypothetical protein